LCSKLVGQATNKNNHHKERQLQRTLPTSTWLVTFIESMMPDLDQLKSNQFILSLATKVNLLLIAFAISFYYYLHNIKEAALFGQPLSCFNYSNFY